MVKSESNAGYMLAEEIANSISHGAGVVLGIVGLVLLLVQAVYNGATSTAIASYSLYGGTIILLFLASTLYHSIPSHGLNPGSNGSITVPSIC